jgi:sec-independent protein translocase protein TatA
MLGNIGRTELIIIAVVLLIIFGPKKMPEFAKGIAEAINEFRSVFERTKSKDETKAKKKKKL